MPRDEDKSALGERLTRVRDNRDPDGLLTVEQAENPPDRLAFGHGDRHAREREEATSDASTAEEHQAEEKRAGATFDVQSRWKEEVVYWEGVEGFVFDAGWGVHPPVLYVPSLAEWDRVTVQWMAGRREEIVGRLVQESGHRIEIGPYRGPPSSRRVTR